VFVRRKQVKGNIYYQLVRNYREDGKHRQQVLCHLGRHKSLEAAIAAERELAEVHERGAAHWSEHAQLTKDYCLEAYPDQISGDLPSRRQAYLQWRSASHIISSTDRRHFLELVYEYHDYMENAQRHKKWAAAHKDRLNKFLECQRKYF